MSAIRRIEATTRTSIVADGVVLTSGTWTADDSTSGDDAAGPHGGQ